MLNSEFRFPLFDSILYGPMNPFSTSNSSEAFMLDEKPHLAVEREDDRGVFVLSFLKPFNQKCSFYHHDYSGDMHPVIPVICTQFGG